MNSRILQVRKYLNLSQKEFGNSLGVSRDVIANYENGRVIPPNSIIKLLCSVHSINQEWLETGQGEMLDRVNRKSDLEILLETLSTNDRDGYKKRLASVMARLKPEDWEVLERIAREMLQTEPTTPPDPAAEMADLKQRVEALEKEEAETPAPAPIRTHSH